MYEIPVRSIGGWNWQKKTDVQEAKSVHLQICWTKMGWPGIQIRTAPTEVDGYVNRAWQNKHRNIGGRRQPQVLL